MNVTRKALAVHPLFSTHLDLLDTTLDSAKVLLSKVYDYFYFNPITRSLLQNTSGRRRLEISEATTDSRMMVLFRQTQRESIHDPATIRDIPPEVLAWCVAPGTLSHNV